MKYTSKRSVLDNLLQRHPQAVEGIMNAGIETNGQELDSEDLKIFFNFEVFLQEGIDSSKNQFDEVNEMTIHKKIVQLGGFQQDSLQALISFLPLGFEDLLSATQ